MNEAQKAQFKAKKAFQAATHRALDRLKKTSDYQTSNQTQKEILEREELAIVTAK